MPNYRNNLKYKLLNVDEDYYIIYSVIYELTIYWFLIFMNKYLKKLALICYNKLVVLIKQEILF